MRIESVETRLYRVPPTVRISDAIQSIQRWEWIVTTIRTEDGLAGTGWSYTLGMGGTGIRAIIDDYLAPLVVGMDARDVERIWNRCWLELHANGSGGFTTLALAHFPALAALLVPFAVAVAASRVVLGLHYPTDVAAGAALGAILADLTLRFWPG
jgi:L-alanine-DL-glutamate epimerase-like enolase superfamily enzyme